MNQITFRFYIVKGLVKFLWTLISSFFCKNIISFRYEDEVMTNSTMIIEYSVNISTLTLTLLKLKF
jgi:hypothetical protein